MRHIIISPDASNRLDPPWHDLLRQIPGRTESMAEADVAIVLITRLSDFKFSDSLSQLKKPWVLVDGSEFGWNDPMKTSHLWGVDRLEHPDFQGEEWRKFNDFICQNPPILTFQRELLQEDKSDKLLPIEYGNFLPEFGMDTREEFGKRALDVSYVWGRSSEYRMFMQGAIFSEAGTLGYDVVTQFDHLDKACPHVPGPKWMAVHAPHYSRIDVKDVQHFVRKSRVTISMPGCGQKCFRHSEIAEDAIMAMPKSRLAWSYPWNGQNSIVLPEVWDSLSAQDAVHTLRNAMMQVDIYELYANAVANGRNYRAETYARRFLGAEIEKRL